MRTYTRDMDQKRGPLRYMISLSSDSFWPSLARETAMVSLSWQVGVLQQWGEPDISSSTIIFSRINNLSKG